MKRGIGLPKGNWMESGDIRPYVFVRPENQIRKPGARHKVNWFGHSPILKNPMDLKEIGFADRIYSLEERAFGPSNMAMPRWVFYDCAVIPGFVAGFAARPSALSATVRAALDPVKFPASGSPVQASQVLSSVKSIDDLDWVPLSLFIIIPTMHQGEWAAHNLCSMNSLLPKEEQFYGLGFLSKAFGLWYANVQQCTGMTQWGGPALRLHSHFGALEVIGAYAPVHSHAMTLTYRCEVQASSWGQFFTKEPDSSFLDRYSAAGIALDPQNEKGMVDLQRRIELGEGPYFLSANEIGGSGLKDPLSLFKKRT